MSKRKRQRPAAEDRSVVPRSRRENPPIDWWHSLLLAALVGLIVARVYVPEDPGGQQGFGAPFDVLWLLLAVACLLGQLRRGKIEFRFGWPDGLLVMLVGWHTVSALIAVQTGSPRAAMNVLWQWIAIGLVFLLARQIVTTAVEARAVVVAMLGFAGGMSAVAVHQYFVTIPSDIAKYDSGGQSTEEIFRQIGRWLPPGSPGRVQFEARLHSGLATGTFALSNSLAGFLVGWLVVLAGLMAGCRRGWRLAVCFAAACAMAACMWLTGSRSGGLAAIVGVLLAIVCSGRWRLQRGWGLVLSSAAIVLLIVGGVIVSSTSVGHAALEAAWRSLAFRFEYWRATAAMIRDHVLFGCGPGQFQDTYTAYKLVGAAEEIQDPHNWLLEVWGTAGTPAAIMLLATLATIAVLVMRSRSAADAVDPNQSNDTRSSSASLALDAATFGGLAGAALGMAVAWLMGFPVGRVAAVLLAAGIVAAWPIGKGFVLEGKLSRSLTLIAAVAILINLSAAGGIGFPSVSDSLWLLLAIAVNANEDAAHKVVVRSQALRWAIGLAMAAVLGAAMWIEYLPVMACQLQLSIANAAQADGRGDLATKALESAAVADPWSAAAARQLALQRFSAYEAVSTSTQLESYQQAEARARALARRNSGIWAESSENYAAIFRATKNVEYREDAARYLERAIELYPTLANLRVQAARFWQSIGDENRARIEAAESLRLDDAMRAAGHTDRVLDESARREMQGLAEERR